MRPKLKRKPISLEKAVASGNAAAIELVRLRKLKRNAMRRYRAKVKARGK